MASDLEFMEYVFDSIKGVGDITYKKMFGEYCVYYKNKVIGLVCENQFVIKKTDIGKELLPNNDEMPPYKGAKPGILIENLHEQNIIKEVIQKTYEQLPEPKPKKKKLKK
ncbi:MAG: TfoX/Sxy family protein [Bacteroidales bacterium]